MREYPERIQGASKDKKSMEVPKGKKQKKKQFKFKGAYGGGSEEGYIGGGTNDIYF